MTTEPSDMNIDLEAIHAEGAQDEHEVMRRRCLRGGFDVQALFAGAVACVVLFYLAMILGLSSAAIAVGAVNGDASCITPSKAIPSLPWATFLILWGSFNLAFVAALVILAIGAGVGGDSCCGICSKILLAAIGLLGFALEFSLYIVGSILFFQSAMNCSDANYHFGLAWFIIMTYSWFHLCFGAKSAA